MLNTPTRSLFGEITDFLATNPTPEALIAYELQQRAHYLLEQNNKGELSPEEHEEMMDFARMDNMLLLLKAKTKLKIE